MIMASAIRLVDEGLDRICVKVCLRKVRVTKIRRQQEDLGRPKNFTKPSYKSLGKSLGTESNVMGKDLGRKHGPSPRHDTAKVGPNHDEQDRRSNQQDQLQSIRQ